MKKQQTALHFEHVSVRRGMRNVLHDISFDVKRGECVALIGPNGSGKSTLLKTITRELYPTDGELKLFGQTTWDVFALRSKLGIISNDFQALFTREMTGFDVVASGFFTSVGLWPGDIVTPAMKRKAILAMQQLDITHLKNTLLSDTSSGEARRLLMARALVHNPEFLIFDEPTNSLDLKAQQMFCASLSKLAQSRVGIFLVTHHLSDLIPEIKRVLFLKKGRIVADGYRAPLLTNQNLNKLFDTRNVAFV